MTFTSSAKHIAVALLDATIRILFADSFQLFVTLYGHQLPILSVSTTSDSALLASGSADKTIKLCKHRVPCARACATERTWPTR